MNRITEKITKTAVMLFALCLTSGAWAVVKPIAVWNGDFDVTSRGGITLDLNNGSATENLNTVSADGKTITIGSGAVGGVKFTPNSGIANTVGIIVKYSNIAYSSSHILTFAGCGNSSHADYMMGSLSTGNVFVGGYHNNDDWSADNPTYTTTGTATGFTTDKSNYVGVLYSRGSSNHNNGVYIYTNGVSTAAMSAGGLHDSGFTSITKMIVGGYTDSSAYNFVGGKIHYVAILGGNQLTAADMATWSSLTSMTDSETVADGEAITGGSNVGVNLSTAGMTATVSSATTAAAVFVQEDATLAVSGSGSINIGDGTGPLYIADGKTLTIDLTSVTAPTAENPFKLLVKGKVFGATQINFTNVPANVITSVGEGGTIALLHNSVYTDLLSSWKSNGQKVFAWRTAGSSSFFSSTANLVDTNTGDIGTSTSISAYNKNGGFRDENPAGVVYYDDIAYVSKATVDYAYFTLGGLFVTAGGSSLYHSDQELKLGDNSSNRKTFNYVFAQSFTLGPFNKNKLYGPVNLTIYEGATLTLSPNGLTLAPNSGYDAGKQAHLMMSGGGVVKTSGTITATGADVTLDYSALDVSRTEPFIQGNLTIDNNTKLVLPGALAADTPYQLCSGTLTVGSTSLQKSITVGSTTIPLADLTFDTSAKTVSYCPARTTTVSGGTTEWSSLTWANGTGTAGWASGANAHITVSAASTISVGSATTVNKLKLLGSADLTITGVGNLTVGSFDLSEYTGNLTIAVDSAATVGTLKLIGSTGVAITGISNLTLDAFDLSEYTGDLIVDGGLPAAVTLCGGNLVFDIAGSTDIANNSHAADAYQTFAISGTGNVYKRGVGSFHFGRTATSAVDQYIENTYNGSTYIENGVARRWGGKAFGANNNRVYVGSSSSSTATVDLVTVWAGNNYEFHIAGTGFGQYPAMMQRNSTSMYNHGVQSLYLDADATIGGDKNIRMGSYGGTFNVYLNGHTLTKVGSATLTIDDIQINDEGIVWVKEGTYQPYCWDNKALSAKLVVEEGATVSTYFFNTSANRFCWKEVVNNGTITIGGDSGGVASLLYVYSSYAGKGSINRLYLKDGVTLKPTSATTRMTVSGALTLEGKINVDLSGIDLTGRYDLPIIAGPTQIDKDNGVDTFNRGSNSANWGLYSELVSEGTYVLGVRLSTITDPVSWGGEGGTWSVNSFNGGTENYSNQALQTVTFADNGESADSLAVAVSGAKTVNALNFTADHRDITLSGDAITAATVSKSGDGVAIVNNVLSVTTSISVTDGVLVLNPNGEDVSDVDGLDDGTLVIYVGTGVTRTVTESITATKIVKRGAGTLNVTAIDPLNVPMTIDAGVVVAYTAPTSAVLVNEAGVFELINSKIQNNCSDNDYSQITGIGTIRYTATANGSSTNWRTLQSTAAKRPASTLIFENNIEDGLIFTQNNDTTPPTIEIGSLKGSGVLRSDWQGNNDSRNVRINQTRDTTWNGTFHASERFKTFYVTGGGILTWNDVKSDYAASVSIGLEIEDTGIMNLSGYWPKNATVDDGGIFGGKGTVSGDLTFNAGSTLKVWETGSLTVSGALTLPESGKVNVDVSAISLSNDGTTIMTFGSVSGTIAAFSCDHAVLELDGTSIKAYPAVASVTDGNGFSTSYATLQAAENAVQALIAGGSTYRYITILADVSFTPTQNIRYKIADGVEITLLPLSAEWSAPVASDPDPNYNGAVTYDLRAARNQTTYTWGGAATYKYWALVGNWTYGESLSATRVPNSGDSVIVNSDTTGDGNAITIGTDTEVKDISIGNTVKMTAPSAKTLTVADGVVITSSSATLEIAGSLSLESDVTTSVAGKCVKWVDDGSSITYSVVDPVAQIGEVEYGSLANAIEKAVNNDTITLLANCDEAVDLGGKAITFDEDGEVAFTGSFTGTGTLTLADWLNSAATARWAAGWTGTVVIPAFTSDQVIQLNKYGIIGSTVRVMGGNVGWLSSEVVAPYVELGADWSLPYFSENWPNTLTKLKGSYKFTLAKTSTVDLSVDTYSPYFLIKDVSEFTGSLETHTVGLVLGRNEKPSDKTHGGKILVYGTDAKVASGKTWTADLGVILNGSLTVVGSISGNATVSNGGALVVDGGEASVTGALTLDDGAILSFSDEDSTLATGTIALPASGTVALDFAEGYVLPEIGDTAVTLLTTETTGLTLNKFTFPEEIAGDYFLTQDDGGNVKLSHAKAKIGAAPYASVSDALGLMYYETDHSVFVQVLDDSYDPESYEYKSYLPTFGIFWNDTAQTYEFGEAVIGSTYYQTLDAAVGVGGVVKLNKNVTANITLPAGVSLNLNGYTLTGTVAAASGCVPSKRIVDGKVVYTADVDTTAESWTNGGGDNAWNNPDNWSLGFVPVANTPVTFPSGTHTVGLNTHNGSETCATITMTGNVTLQRQDASTWAYISLCGNVSGDGTLTLEQVGLKTANNGAITIGCPVIGNATSNDNFFSGSGSTWTFSGAVEVRAGQFKADYVNLVFNGLVTLKDGVEIYGNGGSSTTSFNGGIAVSDNASASFGVYGDDTHTIASTVTLGSGARLTVPTSKTTVSSATFVTEESGKAVTASGNGSNTIYAAAVVPISNDSEAASGYMENATAVITNTTADITVPASATAVALAFSTGSEITLTSTAAIALSGVSKNTTIYATDASGAKTSTDITAAFKVTTGEGNTYTIELDEEEVMPEVTGSAPMVFTSSAPVFTVATIPGLWYTVASGATLDSLANGTPVQADEETKLLTAPNFTGTVQYYKVKVGPSKASVQ